MINKYKFLLALLCVVIPFVLPGCGEGDNTPQVVFETDYGGGFQGAGMGMVDKGVGLDIFNYADCVGFAGTNGTTSSTTGRFGFAPPCASLHMRVARHPSTNCPRANTQINGPVWLYNPGFYYAGSTPYYLDCGVSYGGAAVISPGSSALGSYYPLTMSAIPGSFDPSQGMPEAYYYDDYGNILSQQSVWSTSADGSAATFASDPIMNTGQVGTFIVTVLNTSGDSWTSVAGSAYFYVYDPNAPVGGDPEPGPIPPGGCQQCQLTQ